MESIAHLWWLWLIVAIAGFYNMGHIIIRAARRENNRSARSAYIDAGNDLKNAAYSTVACAIIGIIGTTLLIIALTH